MNPPEADPTPPEPLPPLLQGDSRYGEWDEENGEWYAW